MSVFDKANLPVIARRASQAAADSLFVASGFEDPEQRRQWEEYSEALKRLSATCEELNRQGVAEELSMGEAAKMTAEELVSYRQMAGCNVIDLAARLNVPADDLTQMETGRKSIPARFDDDVVRVVEEMLNDMPDPGPLR